jgi:hypothetical protein
MKKIIITLSLIMGYQLTSLGLPIYSIERSNKGLFGYRNVTFHQVSNNGHMGWVGNCNSPGLDRCKPGSALTDANDQTIGLELLDFAESKIDMGTFTGSKVVLIHVDGETTDRKYTVTWSTDNQGDGTITVDRTNV